MDSKHPGYMIRLLGKHVMSCYVFIVEVSCVFVVGVFYVTVDFFTNQSRNASLCRLVLLFLMPVMILLSGVSGEDQEQFSLASQETLLYTWSSAMGVRELVWSCGAKSNVSNNLLQVRVSSHCVDWLIFCWIAF